MKTETINISPAAKSAATANDAARNASEGSSFEIVEPSCSDAACG